MLAPLPSFRVQLRGEGKVFQAQWIAQSPDQDLAILFVPDASFPVIPLADASPPPGTAIRAAGFPDGKPLTVRDSTLLGTTNICLAIPPCLAMRQGTISHGDSGGSLEANEQLIGINEGEIQDEFAIQIERVHQFLAQVAQQIAQSGIQSLPPLAQGGMGNGQPPSHRPQGQVGMPSNPMPPGKMPPGKMPPAQFKGHNVW